MSVSLIPYAGVNSTFVLAANATNIIGLEDIPSLDDKYVVQVFDQRESPQIKVADIRVNPNEEGIAWIDLKPVLQQLVTSRQLNIENTADPGEGKVFSTSDLETATIQVRIGYESIASGLVISNTISNVKVFRAKVNQMDANSDYDDEAKNRINTSAGEWDWGIEYNPNNGTILGVQDEPMLSGDDSIPVETVVDTPGTVLTDVNTYLLPTEITDGYPTSRIPNDHIILTQKITRNSAGQIPFRSVTVRNAHSSFNAVTPPPTITHGLRAIYLWQYQANGSLATSPLFIRNLTPNGGGPDVDYGDLPQAAFYPYDWITFNLANTLDLDGSSPYTIQSNTHHLYLTFHVNNGSGNITGETAWHAMRYDIVDNCADYSPYTVRWLNSKGFYDYFQFNKKHEYKIDASRNTYLQSDFDYNRGMIPAESTEGYYIRNRGYTTYSQELQRTITLTTDWLTDKEMQYLRHLFMSPDVSYIDQDAYNQPIRWATVVDKSFTEKTYRKNKLFQLEITLRDAYNIQSQRG